MERELTALEQRLYKFLDDIDTIVEFGCTESRWQLIRETMDKCRQDCKVQFGVVNNGYSLHIKLPFDVDADILENLASARKSTFSTSNS